MFLTLFSTLMIYLGSNRAQLISPSKPDITMAEHTMPLNDRYAVSSVNEVFKENILLNIAYMNGSVTNPKAINWQEVNKPFHYEFKLKPGQTFAFHDDVLPEYQKSLVKTTNAHFNYSEGFVSDGYLYGDGVCHLASIMNWVAKDAGLEVKAPTNHNFAVIPDVPAQYGTAIYSMPGEKSVNAQENLYVTNNQSKDINFVFDYSNDKLNVSVTEQS
jgi:hypothetical protein